MATITRNHLNTFFNKILAPHDFADYGPNGLQISGTEKIKKIAFAVSATVDSIEKSVAAAADCLIVHHGLFWDFHGAKKITGAFYRRVAPLIKSDINLFAYHLPLDAHLVHGNAATLAHKIELIKIFPFGDYKGSPTGVKGQFKLPITPQKLQIKLEKILDHPVLMAAPENGQAIKSLGIITGGANSHWPLAKKAGLCAYLTGEMSEHDWHDSQESGIYMFAGGHNATESFGIQSLKTLVENQLQVECLYFPSNNPA